VTSMKKKENRVSIRHVAKLAGVSVSTVSRVLNHPESVSDELREKVIRVIEECRYRPNQIARSLRTGLTKVVGFVIPDITNPAFLLMVKGAEDYLKKKGYSFIVCGTDHSAKEESRILRALMAQNVEGIIITCSGGQRSELANLLRHLGLKTVFMDRRYERIDAPYVGVDNAGGVEKMADYLIETGHRSFAYLCGERTTSSARERLQGFINSMQKNGVTNYEILYGQFTFESGYELVRKFKKIPEAVMGGNDLVALGAIVALSELGYRVPDEVSVVGFDDMFYSKYSKPSLTTVRQPIYKMGFEAGKVLWKLLSGGRMQQKEVILPTEIVLRETVRQR